MDDEARSAIRTTARDFAQRCVAPEARQLDAQPTCQFPAGPVGQAQEIGLTLLTAPERWGGAEDLSSAAAAIEEVATACPGFGVILASSLWSLSPIVQAPDRKTAQRVFDLISARPANERLVASLLPESGRQVSVTARVDGGGFVLDGMGTLVFNAGVAGLHIVFARERDNLVCAAVPGAMAGVVLSGPIDRLGLRVASCVDVRLDGARVPDGNVLGIAEDASRLLRLTDTYRHVLVAAAAIGCIRAALEQSLQHATERRKGGKPIGQHDAVASMLTDMRVGLESSQAIASKAAESPGDLGLAISARILATEAAYRAALNAVQVFGGYGYMRDLPLEKLMRDSIQLALVGGSNAWLRVYLNRVVPA